MVGDDGTPSNIAIFMNVAVKKKPVQSTKGWNPRQILFGAFDWVIDRAKNIVPGRPMPGRLAVTFRKREGQFILLFRLQARFRQLFSYAKASAYAAGSFRAKAVHRVHHRRLQSLPAHRQYGNDQRKNKGQCKDPPGYFCAIVIIFQPRR